MTKFYILLLISAAVFSSSLRINEKNSPFILDSLMELDTLQIDPGAKIFCKSGSGFVIHNLLYSVGTAESRVVIASGEPVPSPFDWNGITIEKDANAFLIHTKMANCIDCINSFSPEIVIDSSTFTDVGQSCFTLNSTPIKSCYENYYCYNPTKWRALKAQENSRPSPTQSTGVGKEPQRNSYRKWLIGGVAGAGVAVGVFFLMPEEKGPTPVIEQGNTIKYPNLPEL